MFDSALAQHVSSARGRYPVSNLVRDDLQMRPHLEGFRLGDWLTSLDNETLEDVQTKLDALLHRGCPDHAGEDLVIAAELLSHAERGAVFELSDADIRARLLSWIEACSIEKLVRLGMLTVSGQACSIDPAQAHTTFITASEEARERYGDD